MTDKKPKVFVTNYNGSYDYSSAEKHGELVNMTQGFIPLHRATSILSTFENYAKQATSDDFLLLSGSNLVCALAMAAWMKHRPNVSLLQHHKVNGQDGQPSSYSCLYVSFSD